MFHAMIKKIKAQPDFMLEAVFDNGVKKVYDVKPLFERIEVFQQLRDIKGLFELVKIDCGGCGIMWNSDIDLDANEIWYNGQEIS